AQWRRDLDQAGLNTDSYTRGQYERACAIMHTRALPDHACVAVVDQHLSRLAGTSVLDVGIPDDDEVVRELCSRRVTAIHQGAREAGRHCDECGTLLLSGGMAASLGIACSVSCYDAMADRPGRYATRRPH